MSEGNIAQGEATLSFGSNEYLDPIAQLTNVEFSGSTGVVDFTNNDSPVGTGEVTVGRRDKGTISADFVARTGAAQALHDAWVARTIDDYDVTFFTGGLDKSGTAFISDFSCTAELTGEAVVEGSITLTIVTES